MIAPMPGDAAYDASYFAGGRVSAAGIEKLFTACRFLFEVEPWTVVDDQQVLRMVHPCAGCRRSLPFRDRPARRGESRRARLPLAPWLQAVPQGNVNRCHRKGVGRTRFPTAGGDVRIGGGIAAVDAARGDGAPVAGDDRRRLSAGRAARARRRRFRSSTGTSRSPRPARYRSPRSSPGMRRSSSRPPSTLSASRTSATTNWRCASPLPTMALGLRLDGISGNENRTPRVLRRRFRPRAGRKNLARAAVGVGTRCVISRRTRAEHASLQATTQHSSPDEPL